MTFLDLRGEQTDTGPDGACKTAHGKMVIRAPADVRGICLHQTAVRFGVSPAAVRAAKGDKDLARHRRALGVHAHVTAFDDGTFAAAYPLLGYVYHGNSANRWTIGLEMEGLFNGRPGGLDSEPSDLLIEASREACRWIVATARQEGCPIAHYVAHRQYAASRRADPGWKLWQAVGIDCCEKELGLSPLPSLTERDGKPIPSVWDSRETAGY